MEEGVFAMLGCGVLMFGLFGMVLIAHGLNLHDQVALLMGALMLALAAGLAVVTWKRFSAQAGNMMGAGLSHPPASGGGLAEAMGFGGPFQNISRTLVDLAPAGASEITLQISEAHGDWRADLSSGGKRVPLDDTLRRDLVALEQYCVKKFGKRLPRIRMTATRTDDDWNVSTRYE